MLFVVIVMSVDWGCRVSCNEKGCDQKVTSWSKGGTPSLPRIGIHEGGNLKGWCFFHRGGRFAPADYGSSHVAYCPLHSAPIREWLNDFYKWRDARYQAKLIGATWWERVLAFRSPVNGERTMRFRIQEADREWVKNNPPPKPPWK